MIHDDGQEVLGAVRGMATTWHADDKSVVTRLHKYLARLPTAAKAKARRGDGCKGRKVLTQLRLTRYKNGK